MSHKAKHVPQRTCVVCRRKYDKRHLLRFVRTDDGVLVDPTGKQSGRGAYVCDMPACHERIATTDVLAKALQTTLTDADRRWIREVVAS